MIKTSYIQGAFEKSRDSYYILQDKNEQRIVFVRIVNIQYIYSYYIFIARINSETLLI